MILKIDRRKLYSKTEINFRVSVQKHFLGHRRHKLAYWIRPLHLCWRFCLQAARTRLPSIHHFCQNRCSERKKWDLWKWDGCLKRTLTPVRRGFSLLATGMLFKFFALMNRGGCWFLFVGLNGFCRLIFWNERLAKRWQPIRSVPEVCRAGTRGKTYV